jgi:hypothetical integral membrane protein (TIGR02206 family)
MDIFWSKDFLGGPFVLLGKEHLIAIAILILLCVGLFLWQNPSEIAKRTFRYGLAAILLVDEFFWHVWNYTNGVWSIKTTLPFHVCSILVFLSVVMLITKNYTLYEISYFLGLGAATQAILTPDLGIYSFPHFRYFQTFISHGSIVLATIYMTAVEGYRPQWKSLLRVVAMLSIYAIFVGGINALLGSNYMFIAHKPETPSLIDLLAPWPFYIAELIGIALIVFVILYLPFAIKDWKFKNTTTSS